jgi:hypothetical protein
MNDEIPETEDDYPVPTDWHDEYGHTQADF